MVSKKSLGDLGWAVMFDAGHTVRFSNGDDVIDIDRIGKTVSFDRCGSMYRPFAEIAAILDFIVEDAIY